MAPPISKAAGEKPVAAAEETLTTVTDAHHSTKKLRSHFKKVASGKKTAATHNSSSVAPPSPPHPVTAGSCTTNAKVAKKRKEQDDTIANLKRTLANLRAEVALNRKRIAAFEVMAKRAFLSRLHLICMLDIETEETVMKILVANWLSQVAAMMRDPASAEVKTFMMVRQITQSDMSCKEWAGAAAVAIEELQSCGMKLLMVLASLCCG